MESVKNVEGFIDRHSEPLSRRLTISQSFFNKSEKK